MDGRCPPAPAAVFFALVAILSRVVGAGSAQGPTTTAVAACEGTLDGSQFGHLVPEQFAWQALFGAAVDRTRELSRELGVNAATLDVLSGVARRAKERSDALKEAVVPSAELAADREAEAAEAILDGRDSLIRSVDAEEFSRLREWVGKNKRRSKYRIVGRGEQAKWPARVPTCLVTANGRDAPHLIPEAFYWAFYFRNKATLAAENRDSSGDYSRDYVSVVKQYHTRMPEDDIRTLLRVAENTIRQVDHLRRSLRDEPDGHQTTEREVADVVMAGRAELIRRLPVSSWLAIRNDARQEQTSSVVAFPPGF